MEDNTGNFVITFPLKLEKHQSDIVDSRMEMLRRAHNVIVGTFNKRYAEMIKTKRWRETMSELFQSEKRTELVKLRKNFEKNSEDYIRISNEIDQLKGKVSTERKKELSTIQKEILKENEFSEWGIYGSKDHGVGWKQYNHYKKGGLYTNNVMKLCSNIWRAYEKLLFGNGKRVSFKKYGEHNIIQGASNLSAIVIKFDDKNIPFIHYSGTVIPLSFNHKKIYEVDALYNRNIVSSSIVRKQVRGKQKYYIQVTFKGRPFSKENQQIGTGNVGIDIGTQTIAVTSDTKVMLKELADRAPKYEDEARRLLRAMDRSRRASNPNNYNENGIIKHGIKLTWVSSKNYLKLKSKYEELCRRKSDIMTLQHNETANEIITQGNVFKVEKMSFAGLSKRATNTEKTEKGKFKTKKRFGKSIGNKAPSKLLSILKNKIVAKGGNYIEVNTTKCRASQYNHVTDDYKKKTLGQRFNYFVINDENVKAQRDLYSSLLIKNVNDDNETFNKEQINDEFPKFIKLHDEQIEKLKKTKNLSSMGV